MGKKQHQKDKLYLTTTEWSAFYGGKKADVGDKAAFRRLPFFCCSLSLQPFQHPYCTLNGTVFDLVNIVPFLKRYGINPVTGEKLSAKDLVKLNFFKNSNDKYHCPVTFKIFNENTHIVAIRPTGNVLSLDAVERLNIKAGFWKDLVTDEPFTRADIITIQDPSDLDKFNLANFHHIKKSLQVPDKDEEKARQDPRYHLKSVNSETLGILDELDTSYKAPEKVNKVKNKADSINAAHYSTGMVAASFTSTAMERETEHEAAIIDEDMLRYERVKKKGYVRLTTNHGVLNLELHADQVPRTCDNFIKHCLNGYYNGTTFHRSIRNFMIQGGDPEGTGTGGQSVWGKPFKDEFKPNLTHTGRGILSMANAGPNTNKSQFFITYRSARHLDNKHSVFGRVVGGLETLDKLEAVETDNKDRPLEKIEIISCQVFVNPFEEVEELLKKERADAVEKQKQDLEASKRRVVTKPNEMKKYRNGVGQFVNTAALKRSFETTSEETEQNKKKKSATVTSTLSNFDSW